MKKVAIVLLLVFLVFTLCACGDLSDKQDPSDKQDLSDKQDFVGVWEGRDGSYNPATITFNEDGTGKYYCEKGSKLTFTWEVKGDNSIVVDFGDDKTTATINRDVTPLELTWGMISDPFIKSN